MFGETRKMKLINSPYNIISYHNDLIQECYMVRWHKPAAGEFKCNVDATIFKEQSCNGTSMCLQGDRGEFIVTKTISFQGLPQPHE